MKPKFEFTSISGIQKAFKVFVPTDDFIQKVLADPLLGDLEATRHLIVHRASRVDEEYKKRVKSDLEIGSVLAFTEDQAFIFSNVAERAGTGLLAFVNDWFMKKRAPTSKTTRTSG